MTDTLARSPEEVTMTPERLTPETLTMLEAELYELLQRDPMNLGVLMRLNRVKVRLSFVRARQLPTAVAAEPNSASHPGEEEGR